MWQVAFVLETSWNEWACVQDPFLPYDDIHDQEVSHQADDADDHVDDHDGGLHSCWQQGVGLVVVAAEVAPIVELQVVDLGQQEVVRVLHLWPGVGVEVRWWRRVYAYQKEEWSLVRQGSQPTLIQNTVACMIRTMTATFLCHIYIHLPP